MLRPAPVDLERDGARAQEACGSGYSTPRWGERSGCCPTRRLDRAPLRTQGLAFVKSPRILRPLRPERDQAPFDLAPEALNWSFFSRTVHYRPGPSRCGCPVWPPVWPPLASWEDSTVDAPRSRSLRGNNKGGGAQSVALMERVRCSLRDLMSCWPCRGQASMNSQGDLLWPT